MKKITLLMFVVMLISVCTHAQTKVFKEVSEEISSQVTTITQDNSLVGYLVFTRLEKANADSFNYKLTIMDENLNDIGSVNFRQEELRLTGVSFEQDILCLAYFKTNVIGKEYTNEREFNESSSKFKNAVMLQFVSLEGKILKSNSIPLKLNVTSQRTGTKKRVKAIASLKEAVQLKNVPQVGFAVYYGDEDKNQLAIYKSNGDYLWKKTIKGTSGGQAMLTSANELHFLAKTGEKDEDKVYEVQSFGISDSAVHPKFVLKDKKDHKLEVLTFANNPETGKPFVSGYIKGNRKFSSPYYARGIGKGHYAGLFTYHLNGHGKGDVKEVFTYWDDKSIATISQKGYHREPHVYAQYVDAFKDFQGNTYFVGNTFVKKTRIGTIISSVILTPFLYGPFILAANGTVKAKLKDPMILKQDAKGALSYEAFIPARKTGYRKAGYPLWVLGDRAFASITNNETKTNYVLAVDDENTSVYNLKKKKVERTIPRYSNNSARIVLPAKDGYVMISEYNRKEKYTRVSIEAL